jgi:glycosyltransferase involved in cell wall biosynthesis
VSTQMKVLHITRSEELGIRAFLAGLLANTDRELFEVKVAGPLRGPLVEDLKRLGIPAILCPVERDIKPAHDIRNFIQICGLIRRERPDVLHLHGAKAGFLGRLAGHMYHVPAIVYTPNNDYLDEPDSRWRNSMLCLLEKGVAQLRAQIVSVTTEERQSWLQRRICREQMIVTIHDGFDFSRATSLIDKAKAKRELDIPGNCKVVGLIARLVPQKAPHIFLQAAANVLKVNPEVQFILVGEGPLEAELKSLTVLLGIARQVRFLGFLADLSQVFSAMDVSVLTSLYEGLPMVVLESMYLGIPIVVSRTYGVSEVVPDGCGFVTAIGNAEETAAAICQILRNEEAAKKMAFRARTQVLAHFGAVHMAEQYLQLYIRLLKEREAAGDVPDRVKQEGYIESNAGSHD